MKLTKLTTVAVSAAILAVSSVGAYAQDKEVHLINCGAGDSPGDQVHIDLIKQWEENNPGYKVNLEYVAWGQCQQKATTLAAAGSPAALAYMGSRTLKELSRNGLIVALDMTDEQKATYPASVLATVQADGSEWGAPVAFSTKGLFWNKDLFEEAGLGSTPPATWDEMYEAAKAIKENTNADGFGLVAADFDNTMHQFMNYVYTNGGEVLNAEGEVVINSPNNVEALEFYAKMAEVSQPGPIAYDRAKLRPLFIEGKIGMYISGFSDHTRFPDDLNWGAATIPVGPSGGPGTLLITDSLAVFNGSGVEEQAKDLAKFLTSPDNQFAYEKASGLTPLRNVAGVAELVKEDPNWAYFLDAIPTGGPEPFFTDYQGFQDTMTEMIQGVILGDVSAAEAIETAAEELEEYK